MAGLKVSIWGQKIGEKCFFAFFSPLKFLGGTYEHQYGMGDRIFQDTPHRVAKFRENRPREVEIWWTEKIKKETHQNITVSRYR